MTKFIVKIYAYDHYGQFTVESKDDPISLEQAIVDKLGENSIVWEFVGEKMYDSNKYRITYEEVINDDATTSRGSIQTEKSIGSTMGAGAS
jgi:hypothetical protein